jgi:hypothetical protein
MRALRIASGATPRSTQVSRAGSGSNPAASAISATLLHLEIDFRADDSEHPAVFGTVDRGWNHGRREKVRVVDAKSCKVRTVAPGRRRACADRDAGCHKTKGGESQHAGHYRSVMMVGVRHNRSQKTCGL